MPTPADTILIVPLLEPPTADIISHIVSFHQASILSDQVLMKFHPPFTNSKTSEMTEWWATRLSGAGSPDDTIFLALAPPSNPFVTSGAVGGQGQVVGIVNVRQTPSDTQHFRYEVQMLIVSPDFRNRGIARRLMEAVEGKVRETGKERALLTLDTTKDCEADLYLYPRLGWTKWGTLPGYGEVPDGSGRRVDGVYYYKILE